MLNQIVSVEVGRHNTRPGEFVTITNGERWFHPYDGSAPVRIEQ